MPAGTVITPLSEITSPAIPSASTTVIVVCAGLTVAPFRRSLVSTLPATPPTKPFSGVAEKSLSSARITGGATTTLAVAVSQFVGLSLSQIV